MEKIKSEIKKLPNSDLATIGLMALIDEATEYQNVRDNEELQKTLKKINNK